MDIAEALSGNTIRFWGRNAAVSTSLEELYQYDQPLDWYTVLTTNGSQLDVTSANAADAAAGTGARTVKIAGLDASGNFLTETVTLNGQSIVTTTKAFTDVFGADVASVGTGFTNAGDIHIVKTGTGGSYTGGVPGTLTSGVCKILAGWSTSFTGHYKVPTGLGAYRITDLCMSSYTQAAVVHVSIKEPAGTDPSNHTACVFGIASTGFMQIDLRPGNLVIRAGQAVQLRAFAATSGAVVQANMVLERVQ